MLSKQITKIIQNLEKKKFRDKYNLFKIEGDKLVSELLQSGFKIHSIFALPEWIETNLKLPADVSITEVDEKEMGSISNFQSLPKVIALAEIPVYQYNPDEIENTLSLVLNGVQDPGNMGTILRVADWFGIKHIFCDEDSAGVFNPKSVQASMGAVFRVKAYYTGLPETLTKLKATGLPVYGTFLDGENVYTSSLTSKGLIVMGSEGRGISSGIESIVSHKLTIPSFAVNPFSTESLNVGVATGIILSEFRRQEIFKK